MFILTYMTDLNTIGAEFKSAMNQIAEAATKGDAVTIQRLLQKANALTQLKDEWATLQQRMTSLVNDEATPTATATGPNNGKLRELAIEVTGGDLRQNLLKLTPHVKRSRIKVGEELIIEAFPSGEHFKTIVSEKGNKLRARGEIAQFYKDAKVTEGDYVLLAEVAPGRWTLKKAPPDYSPFAGF